MLVRWWNESKQAGKIKEKIYRTLQRVYVFGSWHLTPVNYRPYGQEVVCMVNRLIEKKKLECNKPIVEVGCGLGDIIGGLSCSIKQKRIGYDISIEVLRAAKLLHPKIKFQEGTFKNVECGDISCFIMIDFIHTIPYEKLKSAIDEVLKNNRVDMFVLDTFVNNEGTEYTYSHSGKYLFGKNYRLARKSPAFPCAHGATRYVEYWKIRKG